MGSTDEGWRSLYFTNGKRTIRAIFSYLFHPIESKNAANIGKCPIFAALGLFEFDCRDHFELSGFEVEGGKAAVEDTHLVF